MTTKRWFVGVALALALGGAVAQAGSVRITEREYGPLALRVESRLREQQAGPLRVDFHRRQAFRLPGGAQVLSIAWWSEAGGEAHCVLGTVQGDAVGVIDVLAGQADAPPWSCDGEPALRFTDLDADGCPDVIALYPMRPPSGERFLWPIVLHCEGGVHALDGERSAALRKGRLPTSLAQAMVRLSKLPLAPGR